MSGINGVGNNPGVQRIVGPTVTRQTSAAAAGTSARPGLVDKLELSGVSHLLTSLKSNDVRTDKVAAVRAEIEAGTYENDQKLQAAIDRLMEDLDR